MSDLAKTWQFLNPIIKEFIIMELGGKIQRQVRRHIAKLISPSVKAVNSQLANNRPSKWLTNTFIPIFGLLTHVSYSQICCLLWYKRTKNPCWWKECNQYDSRTICFPFAENRVKLMLTHNNNNSNKNNNNNSNKNNKNKNNKNNKNKRKTDMQIQKTK